LTATLVLISLLALTVAVYSYLLWTKRERFIPDSTNGTWYQPILPDDADSPQYPFLADSGRLRKARSKGIDIQDRCSYCQRYMVWWIDEIQKTDPEGRPLVEYHWVCPVWKNAAEKNLEHIVTTMEAITNGLSDLPGFHDHDGRTHAQFLKRIRKVK